MTQLMARRHPAGVWGAACATIDRLLILILTLAGAGCASTAERVQPGADAAALHARQSEFLGALEARDAARVSEFFTDDAVLHVAGMPAIQGRRAIRSFYDNVFRFLASSEATAGEIRLSAAGDLAYVTGESRNRFQSPGGAQEFQGKFVMVWERRAGEWQVAMYALSNDGGGPGD